MKLIVIGFFVLVFITSLNFDTQAQTYFQELNGFRLKQYRESPHAEFGKPIRSDKFEDGFEYEAYLLKPDQSVYMIFEYSADRTDLIWSIQVSGTDANFDPGFRGLRFGLDQAQLEKLLGKPSMIEDAGPSGKRWEYEASNFSVEIDTKGKLSSIKIKDTPPDSMRKPDIKRIPAVADVLKTLTSGNTAEIATLIAPDVEIYVDRETLFFGRSIKTELTSDTSRIFATIKSLAKDLKTVNPKNASEFEENIRLTVGQDPKHVIKFKQGQVIKEIVFKYEWGQYLIWEIRASAKP